ncbi:MAG: glycosyltransferase family 9 protein [Pirellulales bacterium]
MAIVDFVGAWLFKFARRVKSAPTIKPEIVRRILLIQLDHLGDAVISTSLLPALRRRFSHASVDVLAAPWNWEVFATSRFVQRIFISKHNRFRRGLTWLWPLGLAYWAIRLRRERYDLAVDIRGEFVHAMLMKFAGVPIRVGWNCAGGDFLLTHSPAFEPGQAEVLSRRALLTELGARPTSDDVPAIAPRPDDEAFIGHMLGDARSTDRPLLVMHVGAGTVAKSWPVEHWRELLGRVIVELNARVVLVGGEADRKIAAEITENMFWPGVMDWTGRLAVAQLAALTQRASLFLGADSGPAHVAAAAGARVISLFSGTNSAAQWRPWGDHVTVLSHAVPCSPCYAGRCRYADHACMRQLSPQQVIDAVDAALHGTSILTGPHFLKFEVPQNKKGRSP